MRPILAVLFIVTPSFAQTSPASQHAAPAKSSAQKKQPATVVARIWRGRAQTSRADQYAKYLYHAGLMKTRGVAGNISAEMLRRTHCDVTEFVVRSALSS